MTQLKGFKFLTTLALVFKEIEGEDETRFDIFYSNSKVEITITEGDIDDVFQSIYVTIISNIQKISSWIIDSVIDHTTSIWKYNPLAGSGCIKWPEELNHPRKGLINVIMNALNGV